MPNVINANPAKIKSAASTIEDESAVFKSEYDKLYTAVDVLAASFTGTDGQSFITKIRAYQAEFEKLMGNLSNTSNTLTDVADNFIRVVTNNTINR